MFLYHQRTLLSLLSLHYLISINKQYQNYKKTELFKKIKTFNFITLLKEHLKKNQKSKSGDLHSHPSNTIKYIIRESLSCYPLLNFFFRFFHLVSVSQKPGWRQTHYLGENELEFWVSRPPPPQCQNRSALPHPCSRALGIKPTASRMLGKYHQSYVAKKVTIQ